MEAYKPILKDDVLMGRDVEFPLDIALLQNLDNLLSSINGLGKEFFTENQKNLTVSSGYRPSYYNTSAHGSKASTHLYCMAVDLHDSDRIIRDFILSDLSLLIRHNLYLEDPEKTPVWCHLDLKKRSTRIFKI